MSFKRAIPFAFASVTVIFLLATGASQTWALSIDPRAREIASVAAPSIQHLAAATAELRHVQALLASASSSGQGRTDDVQAARGALDRELAAYLELPTVPAERWTDVRDDLRDLDVAIDAALAGAPTRDGLDRFEAIADRTSADLERTIEVHAQLVRSDAVSIQQVRDWTLSLLLALDGLGVVTTLGAAVLVGRGVEQHVQLQEANAALLREQVAELEAFAGRVAHDVLGPLGGVTLGIEVAGRALHDEPKASRALERARGCVGAVERVVRDLLEFARAGARPDPDGRADVRAAVTQALADVQDEAQAAGIEVQAELPDALPAAACAEGVLLSLVSNLVRNAVKHMGACTPRQVVVRVRASDRLRVEVNDTGPGLAPEFVTVAFQPHVRGRGVSVPGLGLGLATVKRLAEAHGGRVGVASAPGVGSTFWFELPAAA